MIVLSEADRALPREFTFGFFKDLWLDGPVVNLPGGGQIFEEDSPETVTALIKQFVQLTSSLELITQ